jgi:DNA-directed RNA polymerase II subunit RPB2
MTKTVTSTDEAGAEEISVEDLPKMFIGKVPIMLRSTYCSLDKHTDAELTRCGR